MTKEQMESINQERYTEVIQMSDMVDIKADSIRKISCQLDLTNSLTRRLLDNPQLGKSKIQQLKNRFTIKLRNNDVRQIKTILVLTVVLLFLVFLVVYT